MEDSKLASSPSAILDRHAWLCLLIVSAVLIPRSWLIMQAHNECIDTDYHLRHGLAELLGTREQFVMGANDPPLGQMILALPMAITGNIPSRPIDKAHWPAGAGVPGERPAGETQPTPQRAEYERTIRTGALYGNAWSPQSLLTLIAVWKAALFVPCMLVIFQWCRAVYGVWPAWLTQSLILFDPTFTAHIPIAALDTLAVEAIVIACFCIWRYFERPRLASLTAAAVTTAAAVLVKHTAVIAPVVFLLFAAHYWVWRPWREGITPSQWRTALRPRLNALAAAVFIGLLSIWALLLFDFSVPADQLRDTPLPRATSAVGEMLDAALHRRWPGGTYIGCFVSGFLTNRGGQPALLFGQISPDGFLAYFPALMTLKVPVGTWLALILAVASIFRRRLVRGEVSILIPLLGWLLMLLAARMNTGFRHFLPAYVFMLMWAGRCLVDAARPIALAAWAGALAAIGHAVSFHPNTLAYVNFPRQRVWMQITDSNLDWGQSIRQIGPWLDARPDEKRNVYVVPRGARAGHVGPYYLGGRERVKFLDRGKPLPAEGLLVISPVWVTGVYDEPGENPYAFLQSMTPVDTVGRSMLVYDLGAIRQAAP
ncbi:MAG: hypothetical protein ABIP55_17210 [Tepidisphaeraceae bacterium]